MILCSIMVWGGLRVPPGARFGRGAAIALRRRWEFKMNVCSMPFSCPLNCPIIFPIFELMILYGIVPWDRFWVPPIVDSDRGAATRIFICWLSTNTFPLAWRPIGIPSMIPLKTLQSTSIGSMCTLWKWPKVWWSAVVEQSTLLSPSQTRVGKINAGHLKVEDH